MAEQAVAGGSNVLFATPHLLTRQDLAKSLQVAGYVAQLQAHLTNAGIPLQLVPGMEVYPESFIVEAVKVGYPITLGPARKYLLIDTPLIRLPLGFEQLIFQLELQGIIAILAHPERSADVQANLQILEPLLRRGVLLQINGSSLLGQHGAGAERAARTLLDLRWVHFIASDAHSPRRRRPGLARAAQCVSDLVGAETAADLLRRNGQRVIDGQAIVSTPRPYAEAKKQRRVFGWLFKHAACDT
jgi:protein-tyrosine phosphatase